MFILTYILLFIFILTLTLKNQKGNQSSSQNGYLIDSTTERNVMNGRTAREIKYSGVGSKNKTSAEGMDRIKGPGSEEDTLMAVLGGLMGGLDFLISSLQSNMFWNRDRTRAVMRRLIKCFMSLADVLFLLPTPLYLISLAVRPFITFLSVVESIK